MELENGLNPIHSSQASSYANRSVLILDQNSNRCVAEKCDALSGLLQRSLAIRCIQELCGNQLRQQIAFVPDLVVIRPATGETAPELIAFCKEKWRSASILALLCNRRDRLLVNLPFFLTAVDDFLSCPFEEVDMLLRVKRLLLTKGSKDISAKKPISEELHFGALVGKSKSFVRAIENIPALAQSDATVLICGETGTGKELFSRAIHYHSPGEPSLLFRLIARLCRITCSKTSSLAMQKELLQMPVLRKRD